MDSKMDSKGDAEILVDTFREGALALLGHDLRFTGQRFELAAKNGALSGSVELGSLHVLGSMRKGKLDTNAPSPSDRAEIERHTRDDVLAVARNPTASLSGTIERAGARWAVSGTLTLCGRSQPVRADVMQVGDALEATVTLTPSTYGIAPFRALGGTLRIADRVVVRVRLPLSAANPGADLAALTACWQRPRQ